ncbi:MAG: glycosyltransferase family 39 protein [Acidobacteria bacterium]|nr:glycosyltransferase family 39 protein [Acidobacteriota bacterium]
MLFGGRVFRPGEFAPVLVSSRPPNDGLGRLTDNAWWKLWVGLGLVAVVAHSTTLVLSPVYWLDEAQIVDWGRSLFFEPHTTWSVSWLPEGRPAANYGYLGPALQEAVFRLSGLQPWAPRLSSVLGGVAAATMLVAWLRARGLGAPASVLGGALLLVDPAFVQACRGGRVDGWAIAFALGAAWALCRVRGPGRHSTAWAGLAGALAATAPFVWPTAAVGLVAVGLEWLQLVRAPPLGRARRIRLTAAVVGAGVVTATVLGMVYAGLHGSPLDHWRVALGMQFTSGEGLAQTPVQMLTPIGESIVRSPGLWLAAGLAAMVPMGRPWVVVAILSLVLLVPTHLYVFRLVYVLPMLAAAGAMFYDCRQSLIDQGHRRLIPIAVAILLASIGWSAFAAIGGRQAVAWAERHDRDPRVVSEIAQRIGPGDHAVLLWAPAFYYPGRQLGWRMFRPFRRSEAPPDLLAQMDYAITGPIVDDTAMTAAGLVLEQEFKPATATARYGPFRLYRRASRSRDVPRIESPQR